jgi:hypothetical protein
LLVVYALAVDAHGWRRWDTSLGLTVMLLAGYQFQSSLWILGTYLFAAYVSWALDGRSVPPLVPAVPIPLARRFEVVNWRPVWLCPAVLAPAFALALLVAWADVRQAEAERTAADLLAAEYNDPERRL